MMSNDNSFQESIRKLRSLRQKLCSQESTWDEAFKVRDFVVSELQCMHEKLSTSDYDANWCKLKIENILKEILVFSEESNGSDDA